MENIFIVLENTLQTDATIRRSAEEEISRLSTEPEFVRVLLQLAASTDTEERIQHVSRIASVTFKNLVKKNWGPTPDITLSPELEEEIRNNIVEALLRKGLAGYQLSEAIFQIAKRDFPEKWPNLVPSLAAVLSSNNMEHIEISLRTLDEIFKKFRFESKSQELWSELKAVLLAVQDPLTKLYTKLVQSAEEMTKPGVDAYARDRWNECTLSAVKIFHSLSFQDLPEYFEDNLRVWAEGFVVLINTVISETATNHQEQIKAEIFDICTLYAQRYEEEFRPYIESCLGVAWKTLVETNTDTRFDCMICSALEFISIIAGKVQYTELFQDNVLEQITEKICIPSLRLRQEDVDLWDDDAVEYLNQDLQGSNIGTRRRGAIDLVRSLYRRFETKLTPMLIKIIGELISSSSWIDIDVVYSLVNAICSKTETAREGATSTCMIDVSDFYTNQVRLHLAQPLDAIPNLKADALKFAVTFRNQLQPDMLVEIINACCQLLLAEKSILHKYSAYCIEKLLLMKNPENNGPLLTANVIDVASLLQNLVAGFKKDAKAQHTPYLMKAILRVIAVLDENTARHGGDIASELALLVQASTENPANPVHTHFLFEAICLLIQKTAKLPGFTGLDAQLMPLVEVIISKDLQDLIPYALQVTGVLLAAAIARENVSDQFTAFVPFLLSIELWKRTANIPAALSVLEVYLKYCPDKVLSGYSNLVFQQYVRLIGNKTLDKYGFQLAGALIPVLEHIQSVEDPVKIIWNNMFQRIQGSKTPLFVKQFIVFLCRWSILKGPEQLYKALSSIQANMFSMLMDRIVITAFRENLKNLTTASDKRIIVIGFANIIGQIPSYLGSLYGDLAHALVELVEAVSSSDKQFLTPEEEQASMYNAEGEFTNPYCRLSYAPKPEMLAPEITNYKAHLSHALLQAAPSKESHYMNCLTTEDTAKLRAYF